MKVCFHDWKKKVSHICLILEKVHKKICNKFFLKVSVQISLLVLIFFDTSKERSSRVLHHGNPRIFFFQKKFEIEFWLCDEELKSPFMHLVERMKFFHINTSESISNLFKLLKNSCVQLDIDPRRDDDASPMSSYRCMLRPTWMISALQHKSKYKSNSISNLKKKILGSHVVVLVKTFPLMYKLLM